MAREIFSVVSEKNCKRVITSEILNSPFLKLILQFTIKYAIKAQSTDRFILLPDTCCRLVSFSGSISPVATEISDQSITDTSGGAILLTISPVTDIMLLVLNLLGPVFGHWLNQKRPYNVLHCAVRTE